MKNNIWISWEIQTRNRSISKALGTKLIEFPETYSALIRYPLLLKKTYRALKSKNPQYLFVQNPSMILSFFVVVNGFLNSRKVIVDAHNVGVHFEHSNRFVRSIGQFVNTLIMKLATFTLVTNPYLADFVKRKNGRPFILPDPFPEFGSHDRLNLKGRKNILFICTFSNDEPYPEMFKAAEFLDFDYCIYISGKYRLKDIPKSIPPNINLTGFLSERDYVNYLHSVDLVVDLTYRDDCLVCGAYEAIAAEKPLVLSDKSVLKEYFRNAAVYTDNSPADIAFKIKLALDNSDQILENVKKVKSEQSKQWNLKKEKLERLLQGLKT
jgi:glycosyltransferase involved in cell wall biosynthesis